MSTDQSQRKQEMYVCMYWMQPSNRAETKVQYQSASLWEPSPSPTVVTGWTTLHLLEQSLVRAPGHSYLCTACHELHGSGNSVSLAYVDTRSHAHTQTNRPLRRHICRILLTGLCPLARLHLVYIQLSQGRVC